MRGNTLATISWIADVIVTIGIIQIPQLMKLKQICLSFGNPSRVGIVALKPQPLAITGIAVF